LCDTQKRELEKGGGNLNWKGTKRATFSQNVKLLGKIGKGGDSREKKREKTLEDLFSPIGINPEENRNAVGRHTSPMK